MRNVFDQYSQPEKQLTHAWVSALHAVPRLVRRFPLLFGLVFALTACDVGYEVAGPVSVCVESGVQCALLKGPLGVCERAQCGAGSVGPCFRCTPQH